MNLHLPICEPTPPLTPWTSCFGNNSGKGNQQDVYNTAPPVYQPPQNASEAVANPHELIQQIPDMDFAVADFNSVPMGTAPFRDIPSILIAHMNRPNVSAAEPGWERLLSYFVSHKAHHGSSNLQDLYMLVTRVVLPNIIITNRRVMLRMYTAHGYFPKSCRLRYDTQFETYPHLSIPTTAATVTTTSSTPNRMLFGKAPLKPKTRPIFRSRPTPNGDDFLVWLKTPPAAQHMPSQMAHTRSDLDVYLTDDEAAVRQMENVELVRRTARVLSVWWSVTQRTVALMRYETMGWVGVEKEF